MPKSKQQCPQKNILAEGQELTPRHKHSLRYVPLNQHLARVLFDSGADKIFVSMSLPSILNIPPITLDTTYDIEMENGNLYSQGIHVDPAKIVAVKNWASLNTPTEEVILNGDSPTLTRIVDGVVQAVAPTNVEQRLAKNNELKSRGTLLMALLDKHQLKINTHKDAKSLMEGKEISVVASVSAASNKVPVSALPNVDNLRDRPQMADGHANHESKEDSSEDMKEYRSQWNHFYRTDKEPTNYALMAFTSSSSISSSSSDSDVAPCSKASSKAYATLQSHYDKLTNDLRKSQFDVFSYKTGLEFVEARLSNLGRNLRKLKKRDELKQTLEKFYTSSKNLRKLLASQITNKSGLGYDTQVFNSIVFDFDELIRSKLDVSMPTSLVHDRYKSGEGYHAFPPPYIGTFIPVKPDLVFHKAPTVSETVPNILSVEPSPTKPNKEMSQSHRPSAPIIKDWVSSSEDDSKALIDEITVALGDLHLLRDGPANDSKEESPADDSDVVGGYMVDSRT
nr:reverse transcriptase domain-containing protein [Tanacetum cinerariifolium]